MGTYWDLPITLFFSILLIKTVTSIKWPDVKHLDMEENSKKGNSWIASLGVTEGWPTSTAFSKCSAGTLVFAHTKPSSFGWSPVLGKLRLYY